MGETLSGKCIVRKPKLESKLHRWASDHERERRFEIELSFDEVPSHSPAPNTTANPRFTAAPPTTTTFTPGDPPPLAAHTNAPRHNP